jgi:hypothetical protein
MRHVKIFEQFIAENLQDKLAKKRALQKFNELKFKSKIKGKQKEKVLQFLDTHWNFELQGTEVWCIGGPSYDREKVIINKDGDHHKLAI